MAMPIQGFRVANVKAFIWANESANGVWYNVAFGRSYNQNGEWKVSTSFRQKDLASLAKVTEMARDWIAQKEQNDRQPGERRERTVSR